MYRVYNHGGAPQCMYVYNVRVYMYNHSQMDIDWRKDKFVRLRSRVIMIWRNSIDRVHVRINTRPAVRVARLR